MPRPRRLTIVSGADANVTTADGQRLLMIDLTGMPNADSRIPLRVAIEEQCDLGHWHRRGAGDLPCWGSD